MKTKIYFLRGENRFVRYVGKTSGTLEHRLSRHLRNAINDDQTKKGCGIRKMLREGLSPTITLITEVEGDGSSIERAYIKWLRSHGIDLWNLTDGGEGTFGRILSPETRIKIGLGQKGRVPTQATRLKIGNSNTGQKRTAKTRDNISRGRRLGIAVWRKEHPVAVVIQEPKKKYHHSAETIEKIRSGQKRWLELPGSRLKLKSRWKRRGAPWNKGKKGLQVSWNKGLHCWHKKKQDVLKEMQNDTKTAKENL